MSYSCPVSPATLENGGHNGVEMAKQEVRRSAENMDPPVTGNCCRVSTLLLSSSCLATSENGGGHDGLEIAKQVRRHSGKNMVPPVTGKRCHGGIGLFGLSSDESGTLLVVATLITTLSYQIASNIPGGYWQEDAWQDGTLMHGAGEPIMRTQRFWHYTIFIWSNGVCFAASIVLTVALLTSVPPRSRFVRGFFVLSYSTLILSFITQKWRSRIWVDILVWAAVVALIACAINCRTHHRLRKFIDWLCHEPVDQTS